MANSHDINEPVAWQFFEDGKWWVGSEYNHHRQLTEEAGNPIRELYAAPVSIHSESETDSSSSSMRTTVRTKDLTDDEIWGRCTTKA